MNLTEKEKLILNSCKYNDYSDATLGGSPWVFAVIEASGLNPKVARGAISSLVRKKLAVIEDYEGRNKADDMTFSLTESGREIATSLLNEEKWVSPRVER